MEVLVSRVKTQKEITRVAEIARNVWTDTYEPLLPEGQTEYMIEKFQSIPAITNQIDKFGYAYYLLYDGEFSVEEGASTPPPSGNPPHTQRFEVGGLPSAHADQHAVGFFAVVNDHNLTGEMLLSKIYIKKESRGRGVVRVAFEYIKTLAKEQKMHRIWLTVNKENTHAQDVYRHFGFAQTESVVTDIGNGYQMDDYIMEYRIYCGLT